MRIRFICLFLILSVASGLLQSYMPAQRDDSLAKSYSGLIKEGAVRTDRQGREKVVEASSALGGVYFRKGYYMEAFNSFQIALRIAEEESFLHLLPNIYNGIGNIYCTWKDFPQGLSYYRKSMEYAKKTGDAEAYRKSLINLFGVYYMLDRIPEAEACFEELSSLPEQDSVTRYFNLQNKGLLLWKENKDEETEAYLRRAAEFAEAHSMDISLISSAYSYLAKFKKEAGKPDSALFYLEKSLGKNSAEVPPYIRRDVFRHLSELYRSLGRSQKAADYGRRYLELTDSLFEEESINRVKDTQLMYETGKAYDAIRRLNAEKQEVDSRLRARNAMLLVVSAGILALALCAVLLYRQKRALNQAYRAIFARNRELLETLGEYRAKENCACEEEKAGTEENVKSRQYSADKLTDAQKADIRAAVKKILEDPAHIFDCEFSIEQMADLTGYNSRYISQVVNDTFHLNFRTVVNNTRIREAQKRLLDTARYGNYTIHAIAQSVGYKSHANFILLFKKYVGMTPSLFQKMAKENSESLRSMKMEEDPA